MSKQIILFILGFALLATGCRKDGFTTDIDKTPPTPMDFYQTTIEGFIVDEDNTALEDVTINLGSESTTTNELGYFEISGVGNSQYTVISAEKEGYFNNYETYIPSRDANAKSQTRMQMTTRQMTDAFDSSAGGNITIGNQSKVSFQANSIVNTSNEVYNGSVEVYSHYIDPSHDNVNQIMPGNLMARDADDELGVLQSFGMVNIELQSPSGEKLNINQPATIEVEVPNDLQSNAPSQIALWYFDEGDGLWKEEGIAEKQGNKYIGQVEHFTTWNCDEIFDVAFIEGLVIESQGIPAIKVTLVDGDGQSYTLWTDSEGYFAGAVPVGIEFTLNIEGLCEFDNYIYSSNVGPFDSGFTDLGTIDISNNNGFTTVVGVLVDCDMVPIANGEIYFNYPDFSYTVQATSDGSGNFRAFIPSCENENIEVRAINTATGLVSDIITYNIGGTFEDVGTITACIDVSPMLGSVLITYNGVEKTYDNCTADIQDISGVRSYVLTYQELLPPANDPFAVNIILSDKNSDLNNPDWSFEFVGFQPPQSAEDTEYEYLVPNFTVETPTVTLLQAADSPGEILKLNVDNVRITYRIKNVPGSYQLYSGSSMNIEAVIIP